MRDYVEQDRDYVEFLRRKVERSRADIAAGRVFSNEEVEARMQAHIEDLERKDREADA
jgi:predicted transcriptional regulator